MIAYRQWISARNIGEYVEMQSKKKQLPGKDLASSVYSDLLEAITNGKYPSGSCLPSENELKEHYGVSRNTIRLAINQLNALGILETKRGAGTYVRRQDVDLMLRTITPIIALKKYDLISILEFRKGLEIEATRLAAMRAEPEDIRELEHYLQKMKQTVDDMKAFSAADAAMHKQLAVASHNELFVSILDIVQRILTNDMQSLLVQQGVDIDSLFYHELIIKCIENQKGDEAAYLMSQHLDAVISRSRGQVNNT